MKFRKRPVEVEAMPVPSPISEIEDVQAFVNWLGHRGQGLDNGNWVIESLEGDLVAEPGDWVIKGIRGEFYPCDPEIFEQTYEPV